MKKSTYTVYGSRWTGDLPRGCLVRIQWFDDEIQRWVPKHSGGVCWPVKKARQIIRDAAEKGPLMYSKYRLVQTRRAEEPKLDPPKLPERVPIRKGTKLRTFYEMLARGKALSLAELAEQVKPARLEYLGISYLHRVRQIGKVSDPPFRVIWTSDRKLKLIEDKWD